MHDIDRTQMEFVPELETFEFSGGAEVFGEQEAMELAAELLEVANEGRKGRGLLCELAHGPGPGRAAEGRR
jgi:hypothetical protein